MSGDLVLDRAYHWEATRPDDVYLVQPLDGGEEVFTWSRALDQARRMASHLRSLELPPGSHIALASRNTAWWILADLAIWMAGHVSVPIYPTLNRASVREILEHARVRLVFVGKLDDEAEVRAGIPGGTACISLPLAAGECSTSWDQVMETTEPLQGRPARDASECATIVYTSGSTGTPKGAMLSFGAMAAATEGLHAEIPRRADDRMVSYLPLAHVFERWMVEMGSIFAGHAVFFTRSLETFTSDVRRARPTVFVSVPRLWQKFQLAVFARTPPEELQARLDDPRRAEAARREVLESLGLHAVRFAVSGSAPVPPELIQWYRDLGLDLLEGYGMTENFCFSHISRPGRARVGYVGEPYPGVDVRAGEGGEIEMRGPGLMMGYFDAPELTSGALTPDGFLRTGDCGEVDAEGRLRITGRIKELFKTSKGKYVVPAPIENRLQVHDALEMVCVTGPGLPRALAVATLSEGARARAATREGRDALQRSLQDHLVAVNAALDPHERLGTLVLVSEPWTIGSGFLTPTMKIRRPVVEARYGPRLRAWSDAPETVVWEV